MGFTRSELKLIYVGIETCDRLLFPTETCDRLLFPMVCDPRRSLSTNNSIQYCHCPRVGTTNPPSLLVHIGAHHPHCIIHCLHPMVCDMAKYLSSFLDLLPTAHLLTITLQTCIRVRTLIMESTSIWTHNHLLLQPFAFPHHYYRPKGTIRTKQQKWWKEIGV